MSPPRKTARPKLIHPVPGPPPPPVPPTVPLPDGAIPLVCGDLERKGRLPAGYSGRCCWRCARSIEVPTSVIDSHHAMGQMVACLCQSCFGDADRAALASRRGKP